MLSSPELRVSDSCLYSSDREFNEVIAEVIADLYAKVDLVVAADEARLEAIETKLNIDHARRAEGC